MIDSPRLNTAPPASRRPDEAFPLLAILVLALAGFVSVTTELMPSGMLTQIAPDLGTDIAPAGALTAVYALGIVLTVLPLTRLTLQVPRRTVLVAAVIAFVISNIIVALSPSLAVALMGRFIGGASHGLLWAIMPPVVARITGSARAGQAMAIVFAGNSLGLAVGAPLSALLGDALGWRLTFTAIATGGLAIAALVWFLVPDSPGEHNRQAPLRKVARIPGVLRVSIAWALMLLGHFAVFTYIAPYLEQRGFEGEITSLALFILGIAGILGVLIGGRLPRRALFIGLIASPGVMVAAFVGLLLAPATLPAVAVLLTLWGAGFSAAVLFNQQGVLVTGYQAADTATSISVLVIQFGVALGATAGGVTVDAVGVEYVPLAGMLFLIASAILLLGTRHTLTAAR